MTDEVDPSAGDLEILNAEPKAEEKPESDTVSTPDEGEEESGEEKPDSEESEGESEESAEEPESEEEEVEEELAEEQEETPRNIRFKEIKGKYPTIFKEFPELRASWFKAEQYGEVFPTVDVAKEASAKADVFDQFSSQAANGDLGEVLATVAGNNPNALAGIAEKILPQIHALNPQLYLRAIQPEIRRVLATAWKSANESKNENLKNSVSHLAQFLGLDKAPQNQNQNQPDPEKEQLRSQLVQNYNRDISAFNTSVYSSALEAVSKFVETGINPKDFNEWQRAKLVDDIITEANDVIGRDGKFQKESQYLFDQAARNGLSEDGKARVVSAYLARVKMIIPQIRQRILAKAQGKNPELRKKVNVGTGSAPGRTASKIPTRKEIREKGMSDLDIINY